MSKPVTDKTAFENVVKLVKLGFAPDQIRLIDDKTIQSGADYYVLGEVEKVQTGPKSSGGVFTRFDVLDPQKNRGASSGSWETLLSDLLDHFYNNHSYLVYRPVKKGAEEDLHRRLSAALAEILLGKGSEFAIPGKGTEENTIYEIAVKFKMRLGGQPKPVINKFYFMRDPLGERLEVCTPAQCRKIFEIACEASKQTAGEGELDTTPIQNTEAQEIAALLKDILTAENGFGDYLVGEALKTFSEHTNDKTNKELGILDQILCDGARIRYIAKLTLPFFSYDCKVNGRTALRFTYDLNNFVTAVCPQCGTVLIDDGVLKVGKTQRTLTLPAEKNKISAESILKANKLSAEEVSSHFSTLSCETGAGRCTRTLCKSLTIECPSGAGARTLCAACPYPEIITRRTGVDAKGKPAEEIYYTPDTVFCLDTLENIPKSRAKKCSCCGEWYSAQYVDAGSECKFCSFKDGTEAEFRAAYKRHKLMLPYHLRKKNVLCDENENFILFKIGKKDGGFDRLVFRKHGVGDATVTDRKGEKI